MDAQAGQRIARARRRRGLSQAVLAGLVGRSESWLSQVERGKRAADSHAVLTRLADVLRVDVADLTPQPSGAAASGHHYPAAAQIEAAMMCYGTLPQAISPTRPHTWDSRNLLGRARTAYAAYQATRYEETGRLLPALIRDTEAASRAAGGDHPQLCQARALAYDTAAALLNRVGEPTLAWVAADRAVTAAQQSGQPLLTAAGAYRLTYVLARRQHQSAAVELAMATAAALEPAMSSPTGEQLSVYGGLHLAAASAAAARYDQALTPVLLRTAAAVAERLGCNANLMGTAFGPINVAIHTMSASVRLGDARTAVDIGEALDDAAIPASMVGRRTQVRLDLARAYAMRRQDAAAVNTLLDAERLSPQLVRFDHHTRDLITGLLRREHRASTPALRPLAHRVGVL